MTVDSILESTSFASLDADGQEAVRQLFQSYQQGKKLALEHTPLFKKRKSLQATLPNAQYFLDKTNPASFKFLSQNQRDVLKEELLFTFYLFSAQYQLDESEHQRQGLPALREYIKKTASYIDLLTELETEATPQSLLNRIINDSEKNAKYLGLTFIAPIIIEKLFEFTTGKLKTPAKEWQGAGKTATAIEEMTNVNGLRLYWVWGRSLLSSVLEMLPADFANNAQTKEIIAAPAPYTGYMSWILYFTRFGINLGLLLKHTIRGPWMSQEERQIPWWDRFTTQWDQRKFVLLNDSIWGMVNLACFFWLLGEGLLGYMGNVATGLLLIMDIGLTVWKFWQASTEHNAAMLRYKHDLESLKQKMTASPEDPKLLLQYKALLRSQAHCELEWKYKKYSMVNDYFYALNLFIAFSILCSIFFPPLALVPATLKIFAVVGAVLCFTVTTVYAAISGKIDIAKSRKLNTLADDEAKGLLEEFKKKDMPDFVRKQLYLDIKQELATSDYQQKLAKYQKMQMVRGLLVDVLIPPLVFVSFMFMPFGIGLGVLAFGLAIAAISKLILHRFEPKAPELPDFDEAAFKEMDQLETPTLEHFKKQLLKPSSNLDKNTFFLEEHPKHTPKDPDSDSDDSVLLEGSSA